MEPRQEGLSGGIENAPVQTGEYDRNASIEIGKERYDENQERRPEVGAVRAEASQIAMPALPTPVVAPQQAAQPSSDNDTPIVANDDDLIEKEWVDKAKRIIAETRDDPYRREREISKLQIEYIRRRYGREIEDSGD